MDLPSVDASNPTRESDAKMNKAAPSLVSQAENGQLASRSPKLLVLERSGEVRALLARRFSSAICLDTAPLLDKIPDKIRSTTYDMFICVAESAHPPKSKLQEILELLSRNAPQTQLIVISDEEPEPPYCVLKSANYQYIP